MTVRTPDRGRRRPTGDDVGPRRARRRWATPVDCTRPAQPVPWRARMCCGWWRRRDGPVRGRRRRAGPLALPRPPGGGHAAARPGRRARSTPWSAGRCGTACCAGSRCASCPARATARTPTHQVVRRAAAYRHPLAGPPSPARWRTPSPSASAAACASSSRRRWRPDRAGRTGPSPTTTSSGCRSPPGSVQYGAPYGAEAAADLLIDGAVWQRMVDQQYRLLSALDRWIEQLERAHEDRTAAGHQGRRGRARPGRPDAAGVHRQVRGRRTGRAAEAPTTPRSPSAGWSPRRAGITLAEPARSGAAPSDRLDPVERIAARLARPHPGRPARPAAGGGRTSARWWATGPRPARRWRCCGGAAVRGGADPSTGRRDAIEQGERRRSSSRGP